MNTSTTWSALVSVGTTTYYLVDIDHSRVAPDNIPPADLGGALGQLAVKDIDAGAARHLGIVREAPSVLDWSYAGAVPIAQGVARIAKRVTASEIPTVTSDAAAAISSSVTQLTAALDAHRIEVNRDMHGEPVDDSAVTAAVAAYQAATSSLLDALTAGSESHATPDTPTRA